MAHSRSGISGKFWQIKKKVETFDIYHTRGFAKVIASFLLPASSPLGVLLPQHGGFSGGVESYDVRHWQRRSDVVGSRIWNSFCLLSMHLLYFMWAAFIFIMMFTHWLQHSVPLADTRSNPRDALRKIIETNKTFMIVKDHVVFRLAFSLYWWLHPPTTHGHF